MCDDFIMQARTPGGSSLVTSLSTLDNTVLACSFMLSLSLFTTRTHQGKAGLEPLAANIGLLDSSGQVHNAGPIQVQSAGLLNGQCLLAGAYPDGLLLLERDTAQEMASCEARQQEREKKRHEGELLQSLPLKVLLTNVLDFATVVWSKIAVQADRLSVWNLTTHSGLELLPFQQLAQLLSLSRVTL